MVAFLSSKMYSIGSSMVTMWTLLRLVHVVEHGGDRRGLARAGDAAEQHDALGLHRDLGHDGREVEVLELADLAGDQTGGDRELAAGHEQVDAEAVLGVVVVREVDRAELVQVGHLLFVQDVLGDVPEFLAGAGLAVETLEPAADAELGHLVGLHDEVRGFELDGGLEELAEARRVRIVLLIGHRGDVPSRGRVGLSIGRE